MLSLTKRKRCKALLVRLGISFDHQTILTATIQDFDKLIAMVRHLRKGRRTGQQRIKRNEERAAERKGQRK